MGLFGQAAGAAINTGLGLMLQGHNDRRQLRQQQKLGQQQLGLDKSKMDYQQKLAYDMWLKTNYTGQMEQLKSAGLNPGLLYGMSGGGGSTTAGGSAGGSVNTPAPPVGGGEIMGLQLMGAQRRLIEAQTKKTEVEAEKTAGVDTELTRAQTSIAQIQDSLLRDTYEDTANKIKAEAVKIGGEAWQATKKGEVDHETSLTRIAIKEAELIGLSLSNEQKRKGIQLTEAQIDATIQKVQQEWSKVRVQEGKLNLERFVHDIADSTKLAVETVSRVVTGLGIKRFKKVE